MTDQSSTLEAHTGLARMSDPRAIMRGIRQLGGNAMSATRPPVVRGPLTAEIKNIRSPVRQFLDERFTSGLRDVQRRYREGAGTLVVPRSDANPGTVGTAADWLLRFLIHPSPDVHLAMAGAALCRMDGVDLVPALAGITESLGVPLPRRREVREVQTFTGPGPGCDAEPDLLARSCWALALLTEVFRGGPMVLAAGPLSQLRGTAKAASLLALCPPAGLDQLAQFRHVFETALMPHLAARRGLWAIGPTFAGSELMNADADLIAGGLLLDLKTSSKLSLPVQDMLQVIGYALLDFDDEFGVTELGIFSARYAYLATWPAGSLLDELAGREVSLQATRAAFRELLTLPSR